MQEAVNEAGSGADSGGSPDGGSPGGVSWVTAPKTAGKASTNSG